MLPLAKVKQGHHGCFFVLRRIALQDFGNKLLIDGIEFEWDIRVVLLRIAMLQRLSLKRMQLFGALGALETLPLEALRLLLEMLWLVFGIVVTVRNEVTV